MSDEEEQGFPIEQDVTMPTERTVVHRDWRHGRNGEIAYLETRAYPNPRTTKPLKKRMRMLASCTICHVAPVIQYDHYGATKGRLNERLCANCLDTYWRSGYTSHYQIAIDVMPGTGQYQHYRESNRNEPSGEQRLAAAIIASAAADIWRKTDYHGGAKNREDAKKWLEGRGKAKVTFGFCCELLDIDPAWMRHMVLTSQQYDDGHASMRRHSGMLIPAVEEYVPDVDGSDRSSPFRFGCG